MPQPSATDILAQTAVHARASHLLSGSLVALALTACGGAPSSSEPAPAPAPPPAAREPLATPPPAASRAGRDLGALPPELAALRWPAPPRIERDVEARTASELQRAVDRAGTRVRVLGRISEPIQIHASDVEIVGADPQCSIDRVTIDPGVHRVRIADLRLAGIELLPPARWDPDPRYDASLFVEDVTIERVHIDAPDSGFVVRGRRVAILDADVTAARYSLWAGDTGPLDGEDLIVARSTFRSAGPESTLRMHDVARSVVVDNLLSNGEKHNYRVHGRSDLALAARNVLLRTGMMIGTQPGDAVGTVFFEGNTLHHEVPSLLEIDMAAIRRLVCRGNRVYTDRWDSFYPYPRIGDGWTIEQNTREPFRPYVPPR
jgi:hypothetical protein